MADIATSILEVGSNRLILQDAEARAKINEAYVTDTASGSIASFPDGADSVPVKSLTVNIEPVQSGSGDPSPDNVRPISGHTQAVVTRCGKNLLKYPYTELSKTVSGITYTVKDNGEIAISGTATAGSYFTLNHGRQLVGNGRYIFSKGTTDNIILGADRCRISDNAYINRYVDSTSSPTTPEITINIEDADNNYARFWIFVRNGETVNTTIHPMIRLATDTDATYEPYTVQTVTIDLGGTRYGGTLDVTTGVLTVDRQMVDLGTLNWSRLTTNVSGKYRFGSADIASLVKKPSSLAIVASIISSQYKSIAGDVPILGTTDGIAIHTNGNILVFDDSLSNVEPIAFQTAMNGVQLVYELAEPFDVTLTGQDITTLLGQNTIWNDCGDTTVEYRADTKLYIDKRINEAVSALS